MTIEQAKARFEAWKSRVVGVDPYNLTDDETLIYFAMKADAPFTSQIAQIEHPAVPGLVLIVKHARTLAKARGFETVNDMLADAPYLPKWVAE